MASRPWTTTPRNYEDFDPFSNLKQEERQDTLVVFLPGYVKDQIRVQMDDRINTLKISGERLIGDNKWRRFHKDLRVPENCNTNDIRAKFENGLLHIIMPKSIKEGSQVQPTPPAPTETKPVLAPQPPPGQNQKRTPFPQTPASRKPELTPPSNLPPKTAPAHQPPTSQNLVTESKPTPSEKPKVTPIPPPPPPPITSPPSPSQKPVTRPSPPTRSQQQKQPQPRRQPPPPPPPMIEKPKVTPIPPPQSSPKPSSELVPTPASQLQQIEKPKITMPQQPPPPQQNEKVKTTPTPQLPPSQKPATELIPRLPKPVAELLQSEKQETTPTPSSPPGKKPVIESKPHPFREKPTTESEPKPTLMSQLVGKFKSDGTKHDEDGKEIDLKAKMSADGENADHLIFKGKKVIDRSTEGENEEERHKKRTEGLAMDSAESRQLLINMGVSLLVIVALGVSVNYTINPPWKN